MGRPRGALECVSGALPPGSWRIAEGRAACHARRPPPCRLGVELRGEALAHLRREAGMDMCSGPGPPPASSERLGRPSSEEARVLAAEGARSMQMSGRGLALGAGAGGANGRRGELGFLSVRLALVRAGRLLGVFLDPYFSHQVPEF